ncbi:hypothetical protein ACKLNR_009814 [Fusarium oxysporum f. sp. zingiberi]
MSQASTPWARKFRDSLKQGEPNFLSYFGALEVFGGEQQLPSGILSLLDSWSSNGTEQQKAERRAVLKFMRTMAAELGYGYGDAYLAVTETKRTTRLVFIAPESQRPGHASGQRKGYKMGEIPKKPEKKRPSGVASKRPAKRGTEYNNLQGDPGIRYGVTHGFYYDSLTHFILMAIVQLWPEHHWRRVRSRSTIWARRSMAAPCWNSSGPFYWLYQSLLLEEWLWKKDWVPR